MSDYEEGDTPMVKPVTARRQRGWETRLVREMNVFLKNTFDWQTCNCGDLMAVSIRACHGENHPILEELTHGTVFEVTKRVGDRGGLDKILGRYLERIPTLTAQDGDLATFGVQESVRAGCVVLNGQIVGLGEDRVRRLPLSKAAAVYRV
jgi:hypothetical protein